MHPKVRTGSTTTTGASQARASRIPLTGQSTPKASLRRNRRNKSDSDNDFGSGVDCDDAKCREAGDSALSKFQRSQQDDSPHGRASKRQKKSKYEVSDTENLSGGEGATPIFSDEPLTRGAKGTPDQGSNVSDGSTEHSKLQIDDLNENLQYIKSHRKPEVNEEVTPYFELYCLLRDSKSYWIRESVVQRAASAAVCTYWGCGGEGWKLYDRPKKEVGRELWKRPLATDEDGVPHAILVVGHDLRDDGQSKFLVQNVGYPASRAKWYVERTVRSRWRSECDDYHLRDTEYYSPTDKAGPKLDTIVGHRVYRSGKNSSLRSFQLSCQWEMAQKLGNPRRKSSRRTTPLF
ncbi:hypothetical protein HRG_011180 [Hirsutella rhossiliensis]|uniref:Uncharacterized protein n=1 Tax=Hirsutella rhossiliensis TaxID=111463 RepID=A0A9P8MNK8_9HYPO|nr:uncharacterized protein HRG_11180 [Hirsutella rhossiliensis]KAH0957689.1 hypothetical protein HRG_11180 [Hirsutella rhossiliensis]